MGIKPKRIAEMVQRVRDRQRAEEERPGSPGQNDGALAELLGSVERYKQRTGNEVTLKIRPKKKGRK